MRACLLSILLLAGCASASAAGGEGRDPARAEIEDSRTEVAAIAAAARDAEASLAPEAELWEQARMRIPMPLDRAWLERRLAEHARRHGLELSEFRLGMPAAAAVEVPARVHPAAPYPVSAQEALVEPPIRFALTPLVPARIESFVRTLAEVTPLVIVQGLARGMDYVEVEATAPTFRPFDPEPRFALETPGVEAILARTGGEWSAELAASHGELVAEVEEANRRLAALSAARLRHERIRAWQLAEERAAAHAAALALPPPARVGEKATRTTVP